MEKIRFGGMATGLDTDTLVKQMMQPYLLKVDKQKQAKQVIQWRQDIYRDIIADIRGLKDSYLDSVKPNDNLLMQKNYSGFEISSNNPAVATATATVGAVAGNYTVNVISLAGGAKVNSTTALDTTVTNSTNLSALTPAVLDGEKITLTVNGGTAIDITVSTAASMTIQQFTNEVNSKTNGTVIARFSELTKSFTFETKGQGKSAKLDISGSENLMKALKIDKGITAVAGTITLGQAEGNNADLTITLPGGDPLRGIEPLNPLDPLGPIAVTTKETNDFIIDGVNYSLKGTGSTTLSVTSDTDKTYDKVMGFIVKYNELIDKINGKIEEKKQYSYNPLTDDQRKDMEPEDIKAWEDKAKQGLIKGDNSLNSMLTSMRSAFFAEVEGVSITLKDLGFTTSKDYSQRGKIVIDENLTAEDAKKKFSDALKSNGTDVVNFFSKSSAIPGEKGIFQKLNDTIEAYTSPFGDKGILLKKAGIKGNTTEYNNLLSEQMLQKDKYITELTKRLADKETSYYAKFARLEKAMNQMNSQSTWLTQQLG